MENMIPLVFFFAILIFVIAGMWKTFSKAGHPGIACIVPIWNIIVLCQIAGKPIWWFLLLFIPIVGLIVGIILAIAVAENFGKGVGFGLGLAILGFIFYPILGFGSAQYLGVKPGATAG
ncbi:MAG: DUF5684 domain-containing protein [Planctomycetales bacterium]